MLCILPQPPRCYLIDRISVGEYWLWCEFIDGVHGKDWPRSRFHEAARHVGQLNGAYLTGEALPTGDWLGRGRLEKGLPTTTTNALDDQSMLNWPGSHTKDEYLCSMVDIAEICVDLADEVDGLRG